MHYILPRVSKLSLDFEILIQFAAPAALVYGIRHEPRSLPLVHHGAIHLLRKKNNGWVQHNAYIC